MGAKAKPAPTRHWRRFGVASGLVAALFLVGCGEKSTPPGRDALPADPEPVEETAVETPEDRPFWVEPLPMPELGEPPPNWQLLTQEEKIQFLENLDLATDPVLAAQKLRHGLNDPDLEVREIALEEAQALPDDLEAALIQEALDDPVENLRYQALQQLKDIDGPEAFSVLHQAMNSSLRDVRRIAASQLTFRGNKPSLEILFQGLRDPDAELRGKVQDDIDFLISLKFRGYDHARQWWAENKHTYDAELFKLED